MLLAAVIPDGILATAGGVLLAGVLAWGAWVVKSQTSLEKGQVKTDGKVDGAANEVKGLRADLTNDRSNQADMHRQGRVELGGERTERVAADASTDNRVEKLRDRVDARADAPDEP